MQSYIAGRLSDLEEAAFEEQLLDDPALVQGFETTMRLREGLVALRDAGELEPAFKRQKAPGPRHRGALQAVALAAAACLLFAVFIAWRVYRPSPLTVASSLAALAVKSDAASLRPIQHTFATLRGADRAAGLALPQGALLELRTLTSHEVTGETFSVMLEAIQNHRALARGTVTRLTPNADGLVVVYVNAAKLRPGNYVLAVRSDSNPQNSERFAFELKAPLPISPDN